MKPMLDKDFDQFFKSSFEDYETAPAADSWAKISEKINPKPKKKGFPVFWMAAASIIIVFGIGISLLNKPTTLIKLHPDAENEILAGLAQEQQAIDNPIEINGSVNETIEIPTLKITRTEKLTKKNVVIEETAIEDSTLVNEPPRVEYTTAASNVKSLRPKLVTEQLLEQEGFTELKKQEAITLNKNQETFIANASTANNYPSKRLKISSVGDLVNFVVAKVDKREEKIIRISKTDESDNEIIGINLGLIKFSKQD